eukprot:g13848.t1 g13848   contig9:593107-594069(-)
MSRKGTSKYQQQSTDDDKEPPIPPQHHWESYQSFITHHRQLLTATSPDWFSLSPEEQFHRQCIACPLTNEVRCQMPLITLPLRVHLIRSEELGCSTDLNCESMKQIVREMNTYWLQAGIQFQLSNVGNESDGILENNLDNLIPQNVRRETRQFIINGLTRGPDGRMQNREKRQRVYTNTLLRPLNFHNDTQTYDVYFFDMIGSGSQGVCISRSLNAVIMGERSTKGYDVPTKRPHTCIAKTMAHELGHALGLGHPEGMRFRDGTDQCEKRGERRNLMCGGTDKQGGGGAYLEPWQVCLTREEATKFLEGCRRSYNASQQK